MIVEFSRRKFLLAAGGATLALPVLEALTPQQALAAFENVRRVVFYLTVNGSPRTSRPSGDGTGYTLGPIHAGLEKHKADMLFVAGLDSKAAIISNGDPHATGFATTLSGMKCLPGDMFKHGACFMDAVCPSTGWGSGPSLDQMIGQQHLAAKVPVVYGALNFSVKNCPGSLYTRSSYSAPGMPVTPEADPSATFDRIFGAPSMGMTDAATAARIRLRQTSALDELQAEISDLQTKISAADKARLDAHLTGLRDLELTLQRMNGQPTGNAACKPPTRPTLGAGNLVERNAGGMETNVDADKMDSLLNRHDIWHKMMVAAFACDLTRVITYITAPSRADTFMPWLKDDVANYPGNFDNPHHASSHANDKPTLTAMDHWYATRISSLVDDLKATQDSEGKTLFERSTVAWFNELGEGPDHSHTDKPHTLIGSLGGFFKTGQLVRYANGTPHNVLLTGIAQGMGIQTDHVGSGEPELQGGDVALLKA